MRKLHGVTALDTAERLLFDSCDKACEALEAGKPLELVKLDFCRRAVEAFRKEEEFLEAQAQKAESLACHKALHRNFFNELEKSRLKDSGDFLTFIENWMVQHQLKAPVEPLE
jgi:hemerythrin